MALVTFILIGIIVFVALIFFYYFNRFVLLGNRIDNSLSQIDVQLKRRADLIPNLIETVKGYAKHEKEAIKAVTDARKAMVSAKGIENKVKANDKLESALKTIFAIAEGYPDLKANTNFLELQRELAATEDRVAYSRQYYNDSVLYLENASQKFPGVIFFKLYGRQSKEYLKIPQSSREMPEIDL